MAKVDGQVVNVDDVVCFKSDVEQCGTITKIVGDTLHLRSERGFIGDYIGGQTHTCKHASECWLE